MGKPRLDESERLLKSKVSSQQPATFEEAITATGFGKFNIMLAILALIPAQCTVFDTGSMSYTFVAAQCDLNLSMSDKGLLNAVTYTGMITSAVIWGFLFDVLGRKRLLILGFLIDAIFVFMSAFTQSLPLLLVSKYLQGFIINGPFAALSSYVAEFQRAKYRPIYQMILGAWNSLGNVLLPLLAWGVLPHNMDFTFINLNFHSWSVFLLISGLPAFLSGILFMFLPESPKFLMTCGENEKALKVFQKVYSMNTGDDPENYPIKYLVNEPKLYEDANGGNVTAQRSKTQAMQEGLGQMLRIFSKPHLSKLVLACSVSFFVMLCLNTLRLWLPQIFQLMTDYMLIHDQPASLCTMLDSSQPSNASLSECIVNMDDSAVYINSITVGCTSMGATILAGTLIRFAGKKPIMICAIFLAATICVSLFFAANRNVTVALAATFIAASLVANNVLISVSVDMFPTTLRTMAISLSMMIGRVGAMSGNYVFPFLLATGCQTPFFVIGGLMLAAGLIAFFLPNTDMKALT